MPQRLVADMSEEERRGYETFLKEYAWRYEEARKRERDERGEPGRGAGEGVY